MKIIKLAFIEKCPHCEHQNEVSGTEKWLQCENCEGGWFSTMYVGKSEKPNPFKDSPVPQGYDRRIRE